MGKHDKRSATTTSALQEIAVQNDLLSWRDTHTVAAIAAFNSLWRDLRPQIESKLADLGYKSALVEPAAYIVREIDPIIAGHFTDEAAKLLARASEDFADLSSSSLVVDSAMIGNEALEDRLFAAQDLLEGLAPLAGGIAMGAALPSFAVVSGTAMFGLVATSTISLPVLAVGLAMAGTAVGVGAVKTSALHSRLTKRMLARIDRHVVSAVLSVDLNADPLSILARILSAYHTVVDEVSSRSDERESE